MSVEKLFKPSELKHREDRSKGTKIIKIMRGPRSLWEGHQSQLTDGRVIQLESMVEHLVDTARELAIQVSELRAANAEPQPPLGLKKDDKKMITDLQKEVITLQKALQELKTETKDPSQL